MADEHKIIPRENAANGFNGAVEIDRLPTWELSPREPHLYDYLLILRKHQWLILSFVLAVVTIVSVATFKMQPVYVATARIELDRDNSNILPFQGNDSYDAAMDLENYIETQSKVLTSETLALQTIRNTGLSARPEFSGASGPSEAVAIGSLANQKRPPELAEFLGSLSVRRVPNSRLLDVSFESTDPVLAAKIVNAHLETFVEQNFRSRYEATTQASTWLADQLDELKIKVQKSEDARIAYERQNQIWSLDDKSNITTQRLADVNRQLTETQTERMKKESLYEFAKAGNLDVIPQVQSNPFLTEMIRRRSTVVEEYNDALSQYGPNFPKVVRLQAQLTELDASLEKQKKNIVDGLESDYREARQRETLLSQALDQQKVDVNTMSEKLVEYNILKRDAESYKALYDGLLTKLKEAGITAGLRSSNIRIVDPAMIPSYPSRPAKARNVALAFLVGLVGGIGLALMREYMDNTVKTPDDVETLSRLPSLAVVPQFAGSNGGSKRAGLLQGFASTNGHEKRIELVAQHLPKSQMSEAFRALRTSLLLSPAPCRAKARPPPPLIWPSRWRSSAIAPCWSMLTCENRGWAAC